MQCRYDKEEELPGSGYRHTQCLREAKVNGLCYECACEELLAQNERLKNALERRRAEIERLKNQKEYIYKKEISHLKTAFKRYATHDPDCHKVSIIGVDNDCTCGFEQALKEAGNGT